MYSVLYTIGMVALWAVNLLNGTGLGDAYHTTQIAMAISVVAAIMCLASRILRDGDLLVQPRYFYAIVPLVLVFAAVSLLNGRRLAGMECLWVYLLVFILSATRPDTTALRMTAICYGVLGLAILYIFDFQDALDGWNANSIAMIGLFSFLIFTIPFYGMREWRSFVIMPLVGAAYVFLIIPTGSRSCIITIIITLLLVLRIIPVRKLLTQPKSLALVLLVPLFVAVFVCLLSTFGNISGLTQWSQETFGKDIFNGRDEIWLDGFRRLWQHPLFGTGVINSGYWHNSAVACFSAFGIVGYVLWLRMFHVILKEGMPYTEDTCVAGSMVAFLVLFCQQSVELGIFAQEPSLLPYVMLGILLGRVRCLRSEERWLR